MTVVFRPVTLPADEPLTGQQIYQRRCASCHGTRGEGTTKDYPHPLAGDRTLAQLAAFIERSMPADAPGECIGEDAGKVAAYIYEAFYSRDAQARSAPPRVELAHLTASQYRNALADLFAGFRSPGRWNEVRGLEGNYFNIGSDREAKHVLARVDTEIAFDFGTASPVPDKIEPAEFSITWQGSLLAPETGEYEFTVRTGHSARLFINDRSRPLIDAWVKSGDETEYRATLKLLGGRAYPLQLYFSKAGQGVAKTDALKARDAKAPTTIALAWKLPAREAEPIPRKYLSPSPFPETLVVESSFPPDDRSTGFERGTSVTREWDQATTSAAVEAADFVRSRLKELSGVSEPSREHEPRLREFCRQFAERSFRRPLTPEQQRLYVDRAFEQAPDLETAVERVVLMVLKSPRFLYPEIHEGERDAWDSAARMALILWNTLPDHELQEAARAGKLATRDEVAGQARRMTADPRFAARLREFLLQWMKLDQPRTLAKDVSLFPEFNPAAASDLRTSLEQFLEEIIGSESADFRQLLLADHLYLNGRLARVYGADVPGDAAFQKVTIDAGERAGILTHPYLMAAFAGSEASSPIRRGVFVARSLLGRTLRPPPDAFVPLPVSLHPDLTTRERAALQTKAPACQACHGLINPLGFALEGYDALGRLRKSENQRPIDATGSYRSRTGESVAFAGARELAKYLAGSDETQEAFVEKLFYHSVGQPVRAYGLGTLPQLRQAFVQNGFSMRRLMEEIAIVAALAKAARPQQTTSVGSGRADPPAAP